MAGRLEGKVAVVTGGANGIGRSTVLRFLEEGARVVAADFNEDTGRETVELARKSGAGERVRFIRTDVVQESDIEAAVALAVKDFGKLDCMFNNAGVAGAFGPITDIDVADWDYTFAVLMRGVFLGTKHAARAMKARGKGGSIINTGSIAGLSGGDGPQAYSAAKAGVINFGRSIAVELAPDRIRVNTICPGGILTPLLHRGNPEAVISKLESYQPWPEAGRPENIAAAALFLASDDAAFITGEAMVVDGGATARGGNAIEHLGGSALRDMGTGVDRGTTGQDGSFRTL